MSLKTRPFAICYEERKREAFSLFVFLTQPFFFKKAACSPMFRRDCQDALSLSGGGSLELCTAGHDVRIMTRVY